MWSVRKAVSRDITQTKNHSRHLLCWSVNNILRSSQPLLVHTSYFLPFKIFRFIILIQLLNAEDRDQAAPTERRRPERPRETLVPPAPPCRRTPETASPGSSTTAKSQKRGKKRRAAMKRWPCCTSPKESQRGVTGCNCVTKLVIYCPTRTAVRLRRGTAVKLRKRTPRKEKKTLRTRRRRRCVYPAWTARRRFV